MPKTVNLKLVRRNECGKCALCAVLMTGFLGGKQVYYWAIGSNLVMRCAWTYKLSSHLRHNFKLVFLFSVLEMLRRFQWIFFRVEVAAIKLPFCHCPTQVKILKFFVKGKQSIAVAFNKAV